MATGQGKKAGQGAGVVEVTFTRHRDACHGAAMVRFENVGMRYGTGPEVLRDLSLYLPPGSFHFLTGASGAGKTHACCG